MKSHLISIRKSLLTEITFETCRGCFQLLLGGARKADEILVYLLDLHSFLPYIRLQIGHQSPFRVLHLHAPPLNSCLYLGVESSYSNIFTFN